MVAPRTGGRITSGSLRYFVEYDSEGLFADPEELTAQEVGDQAVLSNAPYTATFNFYGQNTADY